MATRKIPILDLNLSAFQKLFGNDPELVSQGGRVVFMFSSDDKFYRLSELYNSNFEVNVLDYVRSQRELKAKMLSMKGLHRENGNRKQDYEESNFNR